MSATLVKALDVLRAAYLAEVERLAEEYRPRILVGEFSGYDAKLDRADRLDGPGGLRWLRLEGEMEAHPWAKRDDCGRAVLTVSPWAHNSRCRLEGGGAAVSLHVETGLANEVGECMARDILSVAIGRGWLKPRWRGEHAPYPAKQPRAT